MEARNRKLDQYIASFPDNMFELVYEEIVKFRNSGVLPSGSHLSVIGKAIGEYMEWPDDSMELRIVEDAILFEMGRRFFNILKGKDVQTDADEPVQPGRWDAQGNCSACGKNIYDDIDADMIWSSYEPPHCPNCGVPMVRKKIYDELIHKREEKEPQGFAQRMNKDVRYLEEVDHNAE